MQRQKSNFCFLHGPGIVESIVLKIEPIGFHQGCGLRVAVELLSLILGFVEVLKIGENVFLISNKLREFSKMGMRCYKNTCP